MVQALHVASAEDLVTGQFGRWGIYGKNGRGKTFFARSVPPEFPTLVVSCDLENVKPLRGLAHVKVVKITRWSDLGKVLGMLQRGLLLPNGEPDPKILSGERKYFRLVIFDTWTRVQALAVNKIVGYERVSPQDAIKFIETAPRTPKGYDAWQQIGALTGEWMRYFEELPIHCLFLFQEGTRKVLSDDRTTIEEVGPMLTPLALTHAKDTLELIGRLYVTLGRPGTPEEAIEEEELIDLSGNITDNPASDPWMNPHAQEVRNLFIGQHPYFFAKGPTHKLGRIVTDPKFGDLVSSLEP